MHAHIDALDETIITLVRLRTDACITLAAQRRAAGLPAVELARENAVLARYHAAFGRSGSALGLLLTQRGQQRPPESVFEMGSDGAA
ncbi:chorismate mutase [Streptomyces sp. ventii]|uniref:Chorismate mutase n=1 Tax=Streptomyces spiramenti TaxID=2720606 RepID=A0ABX1AHR0_9ACTN|nr:chorismate mutase [Streptomyces spiramenti]